MNRLHGLVCSSKTWARNVAREYLPWALEDVVLGPRTLEIGPGYGATTRVLVERTASLTALEIDSELATKLSRSLGHRCEVVRGDGTRMPFDDASFDSAACFAMLHHVPSASLQDRLFAEAFRVLRPGGVFAGADSMTSLVLRLFHVRDTMVLVDPETLPARLRAVGFEDVHTAALPGKAFRFRARKP